MAGEATYTPGYCTWYLARAITWVRGGWGNAWQWAARAQRDGFTLSQTPTVGSVVVYGPGHGYSELGHVAGVISLAPGGLFVVSEMAAVGLFVISTRISSRYGVTAFILPPAVAAPANLPVPAIPPSPAIDRIALAWASLIDALVRVVPSEIDNLAAATATLRTLT